MSPGRSATPSAQQLRRRARSARRAGARESRRRVIARGAIPALRASSANSRARPPDRESARGLCRRLLSYLKKPAIVFWPSRSFATSRSRRRCAHSATPCLLRSPNRYRARRDRSSQTGPSESRTSFITASMRAGATPSSASAIASRSVIEDHPVADEAERVAREHAFLAQRLGRARSRSRAFAATCALPRTISSSGMMLAGTKKCSPSTLLGTLRRRGDRVDVERRGIAGEDRRRL